MAKEEIGAEKEKRANAIVDIVCEVCGIAKETLQERSKREPLPTARALIAHFLYKELRMLPRDIKNFIGSPSRNRTSVYHYLSGRSLVEERGPFQKQLMEKAKQVEKRINELQK